MRAHVRITMQEDGRTPKQELFYDGYKVGDLSFFEALELALNIMSGMRFFVSEKSHGASAKARE